MLSPYRLVALFQYASFIMFVRNVTNQFDTSQRVDIPFYTFFAPFSENIAIFVKTSTF